ncbi:MAG: hypothetical protein AAGU21_01060 [Solidesulfovibrio sp.]|uniref:hypothetical protein n=1 Tax=Solidesulfovibrio sp. TaxID=2910990 RepID=UPI002B21E8D9|nr:hypothetical protein [Solidesulfovibrio sp.]MEA4857909.1 hypothetical protein [Solidesulfovibrio sp.]
MALFPALPAPCLGDAPTSPRLSLANMAATRLVADVAADTTLLPVVHVASAPDLSSGRFAYAVLRDAEANAEVVKVTAVQSAPAAFVVQRGQDQSLARAWKAGDLVEFRLTKGAVSQLIQDATQQALAATCAMLGVAEPSIFEECRRRINAVFAAALPVGGVEFCFADDVAAFGEAFSELDGGYLWVSEAQELFDLWGYRFGTAESGAMFGKPDLRGRYIRVCDNGAEVDPDAADRDGGDAPGSTQEDAFKEHNHSLDMGGQGIKDGGNWAWGDREHGEGLNTTLLQATGGNQTSFRDVSLTAVVRCRPGTMGETYKKYAVREDLSIQHNGLTLYQIEALVSWEATSMTVQAGDLGGYVASESNLSQYGKAWVGPGSKVYGNAFVGGDALVVAGGGEVFDAAKAYGAAQIINAKLYENARAFGTIAVVDSEVHGNASVSGSGIVVDATVYGEVIIKDNARVHDGATVYGYTTLQDNAAVFNNSTVYGGMDDPVLLKDNVMVFGNCQIYSNVILEGSVQIHSSCSVYDNVRMSDNGTVFENCSVYNNVTIKGNAAVFNGSQVYDDVVVEGDASVFGDNNIHSHVRLSGFCDIDGDGALGMGNSIYENVDVSGNSYIEGCNIYDNVTVSGASTLVGSDIYNDVVIDCPAVEGPNLYIHDSSVYGGARVSDSPAIVSASVYGQCRFHGDAYINNSTLSGVAEASGNASITNGAIVTDQAKVYDSGHVDGGKLFDTCRVYENGQVLAPAELRGNVRVHGDAVVDYSVSGDVDIAQAA